MSLPDDDASALERARAHALEAESIWDTMLEDRRGTTSRWPEATRLDVELRLGQLWALVVQAENSEEPRVTVQIEDVGARLYDLLGGLSR